MISRFCIICNKRFYIYPSGKNRYCCSIKCGNVSKRNYRPSEETKRKISQNNARIWLGKKMPRAIVEKQIEARAYLIKEKANAWKGDAANYASIHQWIIKWFGQPEKCENCGQNGLRGHKIHWHNVSGDYTRNREDWIRLCASCHLLKDRYSKVVMSYV